MNEKTTYETLITEKFDNRAVPDMADAIWARISHELDSELPDDTSPKTGPGFWGGIAGIVLLALITVFFLTKKPKPVEPVQQTNPVKKETPAVVQPMPPPLQKKNVVKKNTPAPDVVVQDTPLVAPAIIIPKPDTILQQPAPAPPPPPDTTVKKKSRGVKGISNDDYRIIPRSN